MIPVYVVCEGQTEETFVRDVLWEALGGVGLDLIGRGSNRSGRAPRWIT